MIDTLFIAHRINTTESLKNISSEFGIEIDLRDFGNDIILQHDPFLNGESFSSFLDSFRHQTIILNIKSERIENKILELLFEKNIQDFFFLDSSFPMIRQMSEKGERRIALRFSEFESIDTLRLMNGKVEWVWVDCFTSFPLNNSLFNEIKKLNYKICLVSPELQGRPEDIPVFKEIMKNEKIVFDAICTKEENIEVWKK